MARPRLLLLPLLAVAAAVLSSPLGRALAKTAKKSNDIVNGPLLTSKINAKRTLIVGPEDEFKTVQSAIDAVPVGNTEWVIVHLRSGIYRFVPIPSCVRLHAPIYACLSQRLSVFFFFLELSGIHPNNYKFF